MTVKIDNFILEYDNFFTDEQCDFLVEYFDELEKLGFAMTRKQSQNASQINKSDKQIFYNDVCIKFKNSEGVRAFHERFWDEVYPHYTSKYGIMDTYAPHKIHSIKIQKTEPGGDGYHVWHCENTELSHNSRILFFILYLNDVEEGGETEFLYLSKRIKPEKGKFLLCPAGLTHTHRGNPPLSGKKYILTGWVEFG